MSYFYLLIVPLRLTQIEVHFKNPEIEQAGIQPKNLW